MPIIKVRAPDGSIISVDAPEGATEQDAIEYAASVWNPDATDVKASRVDQIPGGVGAYTPPVASAAQEKSMIDKLLSQIGLMKPELLPGVIGIAEGGANVLSGMAASAAGGLRGLSSLAIGEGNAEAVRKLQETQQKYTYQPRTNEGSAVSHVASLPIELGSRGAGYVGEKAGQAIAGDQGGNVGRTLGEASVPVVATLLGGRQALKSAQGLGATIAEANKAKLAELQALKERNAVLDATRERVRAAGFINPAEGGAKGTISGLTKANPKISALNENRATVLAADEIGIPRNTPLSQTSLETRLAELNRPYENIIKAGFNKVDGLKTPPEMVVQLNDMLTQIKEKVAYDPEVFGALKSAVPLLEEQARRSSHNPKMVMEQIKQLRKDAKSNAAKADDPNKAVLAETQRGLADMLEGVFEYNLADKPTLIKAFRDARKQKAQIHFIEEIYNDATGKVDIQKAVRLSNKYPVTGKLKDIVDFGKAYPQASAKVRDASPSVGIMDALFASGAFAAGHPLLAAGEIGGRMATPMLAGRGLLSTKTPDYKLPLSNRMAQAVASDPIQGMLSTAPEQGLRQRLGYIDNEGMLGQ